MKEAARRKLKIVSAFTTCLISLLVAVSFTLAWFAQNDSVGGGGMDIGLVEPDVRGYEIYTVASRNAADNSYTFVKNPTATSLGSYDVLKGDYHVIFRIYLNPRVNSFALSAETSSKTFVGDKTDYLVARDDAEWQNRNLLTSVMSAAVIDFDYASLKLAALPAETKKFIDLSAADRSPKNFSVPVGQDMLRADTYNGKPCKSFSLFLSYDDALISTVFAANLGNKSIYKYNADGLIPVEFYTDFTFSISGINV